MSGENQSSKEFLMVELLETINRKQDSQTEQLADIRVEAATMRTAFEAHTKQDEGMLTQLSILDTRLDQYNTQLAVHIAGVQELKKMNELLQRDIEIRSKQIEVSQTKQDDRITKLEKPREWLAQTKSIIISMGKLVVAGGAIYGFLKLIFPHL